jgi:hypothetical protein
LRYSRCLSVRCSVTTTWTSCPTKSDDSVEARPGRDWRVALLEANLDHEYFRWLNLLVRFSNEIKEYQQNSSMTLFSIGAFDVIQEIYRRLECGEILELAMSIVHVTCDFPERIK